MHKSITDIPEHLERSLLRPLVENFCYNHMYVNKLENFTVKLVEYCPEKNTGKANVYFVDKAGKYTHVVLKIPVHKKTVDGKVQITVDDPIVEIIDSETPKGKKS